MYWFTSSSEYYFNEDCGVNGSEFDYRYLEPAKGIFDLDILLSWLTLQKSPSVPHLARS